MLRTLSVHTVGQVQNEAILDSPLALTRSKVVVHNDLSSIGEVAELSLPDGEGVGVGDGVAVFVSHSCVFAQQGVFNLKTVLFVAAEQRAERDIFLFSLLVSNDSVAMRKGSSFDVLTAEANVETFSQKGSVGKTFSRTEVNALPSLNRLFALLIDLLDGRIESEELRNSRNFLTNCLEIVEADASAFDFSQFGEVNNSVVSLASPLGDIEGGLVALSISFADFGDLATPEFLDLIFSHNSFLHKFVSVKMIDSGPFSDGLVHHRLGEGRLVLLIMSVSPVADNIDKNILSEFLAIVHSQFDRLVDEFGLIGVHMNNGSLDGLSHTSAVQSSSCFSGSSGKSDLVVSNDVDDSINVVMVEVCHLQTFVDNSLSSYCCVTVNEDSQRFIIIIEGILHCFDVSHDDRIHSFEMGRIG